MSRAEPAPRAPQRRRWRRAAAVCAALALAAPLAPGVLAAALETRSAHDAISARLARDGLKVTWRSLTLSLYRGRVALEGLEVGQPGLEARVDALAARWHWGAAWKGGVHVPLLELDGVALELSPVPEPQPAAAPAGGVQWSTLFAPLDALPPLRVDALALRAVSLSHPAMRATGVKLTGSVSAGSGNPRAVALSLEGGHLEVPGAGGATDRLELAHGTDVALVGDVLTWRSRTTLLRAEPPLALPSGDVARAEGRLELLPAQRRAALELVSLQAFGDAVRASARLSLVDESPLPVFEAASARAALDPLLPLLQRFAPALALEDATVELSTAPTAAAELPLLLVGVRARSLGTAEVRAVELTAAAELSSRGERADVKLSLRASGASGAAGSTSLDVGPVELEGRAAVEGRTASAAATASVESLRARAQDARWTVRGLTLGLEVPRADLDARSVAGSARVAVAAAEGPSGARLLRGTAGATAALDGSRGRLKLDLGAARLEGAGARLEDGALGLELPALSLDLVDPRRSSGDFTLTLAARRPSLRGGRWLTELDALAVSGSGTVADQALRAFGCKLTAGAGAARPDRGPPLRLDPSALELAGEGLGAASARLRANGRLAGLELELDVQSAGGQAQGVLDVRARSLAMLAPLLEPELPPGTRLDLSRMGLSLHASGRRQAGDHTADARVLLTAPAGLSSAHALAARSLELTAHHERRGTDDALKAKVTLLEPSVDDTRLAGPLSVVADGHLDRTRGEGALGLKMTALEQQELSASLRFRRSRAGSVTHELSVEGGRFGPVLPLLAAFRNGEPEVDLRRLGLRVFARGRTEGLLDARLDPLPGWEAHADSSQHVSVKLDDVVHHRGGETVAVPSLTLEADATLHEGALRVEAALEVPAAQADLGPHQHLGLAGLHQRLVFTSDGPPAQSLSHLSFDGKLDALEQNLAPAWTPRDVTLTGELRIERLMAFNLDRLVLESEPAGTRLELTKRLRTGDLPGAEQRLGAVGGPRFLLEGRLEQQLARLDGSPASFRGRGAVALPFVVDSADHALYRVRGRLELQDAWLSLPQGGVEVEGATGAITVEEAVTLDPEEGLQLVPNSDQRVFARARFSDLQPFLASDALLTLQRLKVGEVELSPVVGSLELHKNRFALNNLKAHRGPALISGQLFYEYRPGAELLTFRGAVTGLTRAGAREPLDANAAFAFSFGRMELDGRVQVVRASREHVLDLLDLLDPYRELASLNRLRGALGWGYPKELRLQFHEGLLSMDVSMGGLASLVDIGTIRGVSMGPFVGRYLAPYLR